MFSVKIINSSEKKNAGPAFNTIDIVCDYDQTTMGVKAPVGWEKGTYQGTSVEGKVELFR